jgi:hypothetical protein
MRILGVEPHTVHAQTGHSSGAPEWLGLALGLGIPALVFLILGVVFFFVRRAVRRQMAEARAQAAHEGIVLDSGPVWMTVRYRGYRAPGVYVGVGVRMTRVEMILTRARLSFVPRARHYSGIGHADLGRFQVAVAEDGALRLHTDNPPGASGSIDYRIPVADPAAWVSALTQAGAQPG